ncbi:C6 transcription factor (Fungal specific transcription factor) [Pleurostoma richardsiae]|uniref:C6 transcription factor (Fungal specific transcription factor) n=1 Tax=Pleurostoma richardsiae TaxID=41990 RepID=A0AA38R4I9_9PEZI|nr:C6 transcription factor (Fungal specific transcription factor) [Pleurostoma richardsiae]
MAGIKKRACDSCYRRKIQCDAAEPRCEWCEHHDLACTFNRVSRRKARGAAHVAQGAAKRDSTGSPSSRDISHQEGGQASGLLGHSQISPVLSPPWAFPLDPAAASLGAFGKLHFAGFYLGEISSYNGIPFFSAEGQRWIKLRTGQDAAFPDLCSFGPPWQTKPRPRTVFLSLDSIYSQESLELPDRNLLDEYTAMFRSSPFRLMFPPLDTVVFQHTIDLAYEPWSPSPSVEWASARACLFAFFSVISHVDGERKLQHLVDGDACALKAQSLLPHTLPGVDLTGLQTLFMLALHHLFKGQIQVAAMFESLTCRLMFMLGAHTQEPPYNNPPSGTDPDPAWLMRNQLRKLFWLCYTFDKDITLRTGQPPAIDDEHCDLTLPPGYVEVLYAEQEHDASVIHETAIPMLPSDLPLTLLKSKTCNVLYSAKALHKSDAELLRDIRELDDELEHWRLSMPPKWRPTLSFSDRTILLEPDGTASPRSMQSIIIHIEYHYLMAAIHRASGRCRAWANRESGELEGVSSSLALSVEASRSTLLYLRAAMHARFSQAFWMIIFYPLSAVLTIFCNVLLKPLDPRAEQDLELLNSALELVKRMRTSKLTPDEEAHMAMVDGFIAELTRLGTCAVQKARQEQVFGWVEGTLG